MTDETQEKQEDQGMVIKMGDAAAEALRTGAGIAAWVPGAGDVVEIVMEGTAMNIEAGAHVVSGDIAGGAEAWASGSARTVASAIPYGGIIKEKSGEIAGELMHGIVGGDDVPDEKAFDGVQANALKSKGESTEIERS